MFCIEQIYPGLSNPASTRPALHFVMVIHPFTGSAFAVSFCILILDRLYHPAVTSTVTSELFDFD